MKVKCIKELEEWRTRRDVTVGKTYRVNGKEDECYYLFDDTGYCAWYYKDRFKMKTKTKKKYTKKQLIKLIKDSL